MSRPRKEPPEPDDALAAYWRAIYRTNVSGLANRKDYEIAFAALGRERRESLCGQVPFALALREAGVPFEGFIEVGTYPPNAELPPQVREYLLDIEEVVDATGTQVIEMREQDGPGSERFTPGARQERGIWMVVFGDNDGTRVRELAWTPDGDGWKVSAFAEEQAARHGWSRADYATLQVGLADRLPAPDSEEIAHLTAGRPVGPPDDEEDEGGAPWITYAEMADLITR